MYKVKMRKSFSTQRSGGKGNMGLFIERDPKICAAGLPTAQFRDNVKDHLSCYSLNDEVSALIGDSIIPVPQVSKVPPLKHPSKRDMRHASIFSEGSKLINPPVKSKSQTLVEDLKDTAYKSYWTKEIGSVVDPVRSLPEGFKIYDTTLGCKTDYHDRLYDIVLPIDPIPDKNLISKNPGYQINRGYRSFNPNKTFGQNTNADPSGTRMKCCLRDSNVCLGTALKKPITERQAKFQSATVARLGVAQTPIDSITKYVPEGHTFGKISPTPDNLAECLRSCDLNPFKDEITKCLGHLNTLRKCLAKRFDKDFFRKLYLNFKFYDVSKSGWLQKQIIYHQCYTKYIQFNPKFIEPLLSIWQAFDGSQIEYKSFIRIINHMEPCPDLPKIRDIPIECLDFRTTYNEMIKGDIKFGKAVPRAGISSARYFDKEYPVTPAGCCKADTFYLPEESDMKVCLSPSVFTLLGISHRDMYAKRDPKIVRTVFENSGEIFDDEKFEQIWEIAKKYHSQQWVCFETFRRSITEYKDKMYKN